MSSRFTAVGFLRERLTGREAEGVRTVGGRKRRTVAERQQVAKRKWSLNLEAKWLFVCALNCSIVTRKEVGSTEIAAVRGNNHCGRHRRENREVHAFTTGS